jgi:DNA-binding Lrp family transcriptional regulator
MEKLTKLDRQLLAELEKNARQSNSQIATKLKTSKQVVAYRINRLVEKGIISEFVTSVNLSLLQMPIYACIYFKLKDSNTSQQKKVMDYLSKHKMIMHVVECGGQYDLFIIFTGRDVWDVQNLMEEILEKFPEALEEYEISFRTSSSRMNRKYLQTKEQPKYEYMDLFEKINLDKTNIEILKILTKNSRASLLEISTKIKTPISTVRERIKYLVKHKVIQHFSIRVNPLNMGNEIYKILIWKNFTAQEKAKLKEFFKEKEELTGLNFCLGHWTAEILIEVKTQKELRKVLKDLRGRFNFSQMTVLVIFEVLKKDFSAIINVLEKNLTP